MTDKQSKNSACGIGGGKTILVVDLGTTFGGAEIYLEGLLGALKEHLNPVVLCSNREFIRRLQLQGITTVVLPTAGGVRKVLQLLHAAALLPGLLVRYQADAVHINGYSEIVLLPVARLMRRRAIATRHLSFEIEESYWYKAPGRYAARFVYRQWARVASCVVCVSEEVGRQVREIVPAGQVKVIPNWASVIPPFRPAPERTESAVTLLFVGRLVEYKGLQVLLAAMQDLMVRRPDLRCRLVVVGEGPFREPLGRLADGLDVRFAGFQSDVPAFYHDADILVSPSLGPEGSCLVGIEAMAHSLPCLLSDLPVYKEIALEGKAAALFRSGDPIDLADQLAKMIGDPDLRRHYAEAGYIAATANHSLGRAVTDYLEVFGESPVVPRP